MVSTWKVSKWLLEFISNYLLSRERNMWQSGFHSYNCGPRHMYFSAAVISVFRTVCVNVEAWKKISPQHIHTYECVYSIGFSIYEFCTLLVVPLKLNNCRWMSQSDNPQYVCLFLVCLFSWCSFLNRNSCLRQKRILAHSKRKSITLDVRVFCAFFGPKLFLVINILSRFSEKINCEAIWIHHGTRTEVVWRTFPKSFKSLDAKKMLADGGEKEINLRMDRKKGIRSIYLSWNFMFKDGKVDRLECLPLSWKDFHYNENDFQFFFLPRPDKNFQPFNIKIYTFAFVAFCERNSAWSVPEIR